MGLTKKLELTTIPFSKLPKLEVHRVAKDVIRIMGNHDCEELKIEEMKVLFSALQPEIDALEVPHKRHEITPELKSPREMRALYLSALLFQLKVIKKEKATKDDRSVVLIETELNRFFDKLAESQSEKIMNTKVAQFLKELTKNAVLAEALDEMGFMVILENLQNSVQELDTLLNTRATSKSQRLKVKTIQLRRPVIAGINNVMSDIRLAKFKNPDLDYNPLIAEMNEMLNEYAILLSKRKAHNKRKAEGELEENEGEMPLPGGETGEPIALMKMSDNGKNGELNELLDEKKAAALGSNTMQLSELNSNTSI